MASSEVIKAVFANVAVSDFSQNIIFGKLNYTMSVEANDISNVRYGLLVILALSSLTVYGLIIAG
jgi:NADH:ubiquinone oxidoreductase subunit H